MTPQEMEAEVIALRQEQERTRAQLAKLTRLLGAVVGEEAVAGAGDQVRAGFLEFRQRVRANLARRGNR